MARSKPCPLCGKPPLAAFSPFCSQGCRDRDLLQWLGEGYAIPVRTLPSEDDEDGLDTPQDRD
ncbi:DNA gyrase inhibitor YacG [Sphingomonas sp. AAP5]|uniref:DNA gyrase inhibitor YacG n=1 Tax=unclassified Sphingomonas TaxID=196159 RepID=UPI00105757B3|nr:MULTISPECIES: DNA gyrase inhibitor YacG [unclassified Sphingomonas]MDY7523753.1 DNA gyrase inhibitor YacG [Sphingomonas sp. 10B4]MEB0283635.1 DNA gyrase inhibitor YacG [Sphingomonas sp. 10B4]QBM76672.1 DNA gyrase inhibitor YacG [Sphingomonas sp. AAP5]